MRAAVNRDVPTWESPRRRVVEPRSGEAPPLDSIGGPRRSAARPTLLLILLEPLVAVFFDVTHRQGDVAPAVLAGRLPGDSPARPAGVEFQAVFDHVRLTVAGR